MRASGVKPSGLLPGFGILALLSLATAAWGAAEPNWNAIQAETLEHFTRAMRIDTTNPPGNETQLAEYVKSVLEKEHIPVKLFARDPARANLIARLRGNGTKRPILIMGH